MEIDNRIFAKFGIVYCDNDLDRTLGYDAHRHLASLRAILYGTSADHLDTGSLEFGRGIRIQNILKGAVLLELRDRLLATLARYSHG